VGFKKKLHHFNSEHGEERFCPKKEEKLGLMSIQIEKIMMLFLFWLSILV
jgi:hypothetical protein